jgi:O-antigen ligase
MKLKTRLTHAIAEHWIDRLLITVAFFALLSTGMQMVVVFKIGGRGISVGELTLLIFLFLSGSHFAKKQYIEFFKPQVVCGGILTFVILLSVFLASDINVSVRYFIRYAIQIWLLIFTVALFAGNKHISDIFAKAALFLIIVNASLGILSQIHPVFFLKIGRLFHDFAYYEATYPREYGIYPHPGIFGSVGVAGIFLALHCAFRNVIGKYFATTAVICGIIMLVLSGSRNPWFALVLGALTSFFALIKLGYWKKALQIGGAVGLLSLLLYAIHPLTRSRINLLFIHFFDNFNIRALTRGRTVIWQSAISAFGDSPWLGFGPGVFTFHDKLNEDLARAGIKYMLHGHNAVFTLIPEIGIIGCLAVLVFFILFNLPLIKATKGAIDIVWILGWTGMFAGFFVFDYYAYFYGFMVFCILIQAHLFAEYFRRNDLKLTRSHKNYFSDDH